MSNVLLEAAASGRPIIAADRAGCRETLDDGVTGFLVPINNKNAVLDATEKILKMSDTERKKMGLRGSEKIRSEFDRKIVVEAYWNEINAAMKRK
jgi:galacturonosyltransferase